MKIEFLLLPEYGEQSERKNDHPECAGDSGSARTRQRTHSSIMISKSSFLVEACPLPSATVPVNVTVPAGAGPPPGPFGLCHRASRVTGSLCESRAAAVTVPAGRPSPGCGHGVTTSSDRDCHGRFHAQTESPGG